MKNLLVAFAVLMSITLTAQNKLNPAKTSTKWLKKSQLVFAYSTPDSMSFAVEKKSGDKWVFEYRFAGAEYVEIADDEKIELVGFQIAPVKGTSFKLSNEQLIKANAYFMLGCFCKDRGYKHIETGSISGKKINATTWKITFNLTIETGSGTITRKYSGNFKLANN